jgi:hypothetical protein
MEIPFEDIEIVTKKEYASLKQEIERLKEIHLKNNNTTALLANIPEERVKLLLNIEEKMKQLEGTSNALEISAQSLIADIGIIGEQIVYDYLVQHFNEKRVIWVSQSEKNLQGRLEHRYDFEVLHDDLRTVMYYIDAKATITAESESDKIPILLRQSTWHFMMDTENTGKQIFLARVFGVNNTGAHKVHLLRIMYQNII